MVRPNPMDSRPSLGDLEGLILYSDLRDEDLEYLQAVLGRRLQEVRKARAARLRFGMRVGFGVRGARGKRAWREGKFLVFARSRVRIDCDGVVWNVPLSMVEILEDASREQGRSRNPGSDS